MFSEASQIGPYTLLRKLGSGGFGEVWFAERRAKFVTTKVAVKLPHSDAVDHDAIKREAMLWEQASGHPNIVPILDADEYDGQIVIVSEYAPDGSLDQWLKGNGKMSAQQAVETVIQILEGLAFLHSRNIIHRDLKPANILLQGTTPRLADFGISRVLRTTVASESQNISGTFAYMSPEALDGKRSAQTDIWAVGVNFYQFLTGVLPFPQKEPSILFPAIIMRDFEPLHDEVPRDLKYVISKALAKLPENRYASASAMGDDLRRILADGIGFQIGQATETKLVPTTPETDDSLTVETVLRDKDFSRKEEQILQLTPRDATDLSPKLSTRSASYNDYFLPSTEFLTPAAPRIEQKEAELRDIATEISAKTSEFNVTGRVVNICPGPVVTTYEFKPDPGVKYSRITGLVDDLCH